MRKRLHPVKGFNSVGAASGYAIRFEQSKSGYWSAVTTGAKGMCVGGLGSTVGKCRKSIGDGIRYMLEYLNEKGEPIPEPARREVPFSY